MTFAEVAVDAPVEHGRTFSYAVPQGLKILPGQLVRVPFGPRTLQGVVFSLGPEPQVAETRDLLGPVFQDPVLSETALALARWTSGSYICSLFEAASPMLPPGGRVRPRTYYEPDPDLPDADTLRLTPLQARVLKYLADRGRVAEGRILRALGEATRASLHSLVNRGLLLRSYGSATPTVRPIVVSYVRLAPGRGAGVTEEMPSFSKAPRQAALLEHMVHEDAPLTLAAASKQYGASAVNALVSKGWLVKESVAVDRDPLAGKPFPQDTPVEMTRQQLRAASAVQQAIADPTVAPRSFLLNGVTGSGKTEIYLDATARCLAAGKRAIVLVPEIALTHQTIERFAARFPGQVAVLHSGLTAGQRFDQWWKIARGRYGIVIGSRSAVFAPQPDLGLVVIDEEHEWTYKQSDASPRYHARDVAAKLAKLTGAVLLAGSASPDVGSYYRATRGRSRLLSLPARVGPASGNRGPRLPAVQVVDMRRELREGNRLVFSRPLVSRLAETLDSGAQAILFLNRRGYASQLQCRNCGSALKCRRCDVALTYHKNRSRLMCHYCGDRRRPPPKCPECLSFRLSYYGLGTQTVVDEVAKQFPGVGVLRLDRDAGSGRDPGGAILAKFRAREAQVLVGTQMIAKGLHFPSVTLVGVVLADLGLNVPDYQAGERTFQVLCQVAGRAGRGLAGGKVVIQTFQPDNYAIRAAAAQDYGRFFSQEFAYRAEQGNPPLARLIRLLFSHTNRAASEEEALRMSEFLRRERDGWGYSDVEVIGPTPGHPARVRGRFRWQVVLRGPRPRALLDTITVPHGWVVDVDPVGLA